jgi:hypothetical protein
VLPLLQQATYAMGQWNAWLEQGYPPSSWQVWLNQMVEVARFRSGGQAGIPDDDFYRAARRYAEGAGAPETVRQVIAFRHALSLRPPGDLRSLLLEAYVTTAEEQRAAAMRPR